MVRVAIMAVLFVAGAVLLIRYVQSAMSIFEIRVTSTRFVTRGKIPHRHDAELKSFLNELQLPDGARIRAKPAAGSFDLEFSPNISPAARQQIRNFFFT